MPNTPHTVSATILLAHGSSDPAWSQAFTIMTQKSRSEFPETHIAFMELSKPSLQDVIRTLHKKHITHFDVIPLFLSKGKHLKKDIPNILDTLKKELQITYLLRPPIGEHPALEQAIFDIVQDYQTMSRN